MGAREIARDIGNELKSNGFHVTIKPVQGTWTTPSCLEVEAGGEKMVLPFWSDQGLQEKTIARALLKDVYRFIGRPDLASD